MIPTEEYQQCTSSGRHHQESAICEDVVVKLSGSVFPPDRLLLLLIVAIQNTKIKVTARIVLCPVVVISIENTVDDQVSKCEKQRRYSARVLLKIVSLQKRIEHEARIWKGKLGCDIGSWDRTCIRSASLTQGRDQRIVERPVSSSVRIFDVTLRYVLVGEVQWIRRQVIARWMRKILID